MEHIPATSSKAEGWEITFSDNSTLLIHNGLNGKDGIDGTDGKDGDAFIESIVEDKENSVCTITLTDNRKFEFQLVKSYATSIVMLSPSPLYLEPKGEVKIQFIINPSDAALDLNVENADCQIALNLIEDATRSSLTLNEPKGYKITSVEGVTNKSGENIPGQYIATIKDLGVSVGYTDVVVLVVAGAGKAQISSQPITLQSTVSSEIFAPGLPVVMINTPNDAEIVSKNDWMANASLTIYNADGSLNYEGSLSVKGRGNSTWVQPKKPYALKLDSKSEILGIPKHKRWCLLAEYFDPGFLRNNLAFWIGNKISTLEWTPRTSEVNLILNGKYNGIYLLTEQIKIDKNRVNVGDDGFVMEIDIRAADEGETDPHFKIDHIGQWVAVKDYDENPQSLEYIENFIREADALLFSDNYLDETKGWKSMIDMDSFIEWYLINEITKNNDAIFYSSCYMNLKRGEKLKMGPLWDFDISMGNNFEEGGSTKANNPEGFYIKNVDWYARMYSDPTFVNALKKRFYVYYDAQPQIFNQIDQIVERTNKAYFNDFNLWRFNQGDCYSFRNARVDYLKNWLRTRFQWLKTEFDKM